MNTDKKSTFAPQSNKNAAKQEKAPAFRVETGIRAGWVPGSNVRESIRNMRANMSGAFAAPEIR